MLHLPIRSLILEEYYTEFSSRSIMAFRAISLVIFENDAARSAQLQACAALSKPKEIAQGERPINVGEAIAIVSVAAGMTR